jgi:Uma2 family endonuclease
MPGRDDVLHPHPANKLTYDDFVRLPDDGMCHELVGGVHVVTPSPGRPHQQVSGDLFGMIWTYLQTNPIGELFHAPFDVVFSRVDVVEPDLLYLSNERAREVLTTTNVQGVPNLVVEILSSSTRERDESEKRRLYERSGVDEYWVVDPELGLVRIYRQDAAGFGAPVELSAAARDVLTTTLLPGLEVPLKRLFRQ